MSFALVGQVAGSYFFGPWGALGGALLGGAIDAKLAPGPDAGDLSAPSVSLGTRIPRVYGTVRVPLHPISISDYIATEHGGKGAPEPATLSFSLDMLGVFADGSNVEAVLRVWANKKLVDTRHGSSSTNALAAAMTPDWCTSWTFYDGNPAQMPAPLYEDRVLTANALAYRGMATMEIAGLACGGSKAPPAIEVEVSTNVTETVLECGVGRDEQAVNWTLGDDITITDVRCDPDFSMVWPNLWSLDVTQKVASIAGTNTVSTCSGFFIYGVNDIVGDFAVSVGCRYAEFEVNDTGTSSANTVVHVGLRRADGTLYTINDVTFISLATDGVLQVAYEAPTGNLWIGRNNVWYGGGDPAAGTFPTLGGVSGEVSLFVRYTPDNPNATWTLRTVSADFDYPIPTGFYAWGCRSFTGPITSYTPQPELLSDIILAELALDPEFDPADVDVTDVDDIEVTGYTAIGPASETIAELCRMYYVDVVPGNPIKFVKLGKAVVTTIDNVDTGVAVGEPGQRFAGLKRENADETVAVAAIRFPLIDRDHEPGYERGDRLTAQSDDSTAITTRVVFTAEEGKGRALAFTLMNRVKRHKAAIQVSDKFAALDPGDCATVEDNDGNTMRLNARRFSYADGVKQVEWELDDTTALIQTGITDTDYTPSYNPTPSADVTLYLLDTPIFRDADNSYGLYACVTATGDWRYADVFKSTDALTYTNVGRLTNRATAGLTSGALADFTGWGWDTASTLTVELDAGSGGTLASSTVAGVEADASVNVALVGAHGRWEVIRFVTATLVTGTTYLLSKFLRGQFGTEAYNGTHQTGDTFILVQPNGMLRIAGTLSDVGVSRSYKAVAAGKQIANVTAQTLTTAEVGLTPYAPVDLRIDEDGGDLLWNRRTRFESRFLFGAEIPLGEASEAYDVQILNGSTETASGTVTSAQFTSAEVVATRTARVWQLSASIGRGQQAEEVL